MAHMPGQCLLSRREAAERLSISISTLNRLIGAGVFDVRRVGERGVRITSDSVEKYIQSRQQTFRLCVHGAATAGIKARDGADEDAESVEKYRPFLTAVPGLEERLGTAEAVRVIQAVLALAEGRRGPEGGVS